MTAKPMNGQYVAKFGIKKAAKMLIGTPGAGTLVSIASKITFAPLDAYLRQQKSFLKKSKRCLKKYA